jgi:4'-phosphopantetheinyl transferase
MLRTGLELMMTPLNTIWVPGPVEPKLSDHEVHLWRASLDNTPSDLPALEEAISADERTRANRFCFERDKKRYIIGRAILRMILSRYLRIEPKQLSFRYGSRGKPSLADATATENLHFNLSHSHELALYAVSRGREVGVDLEYLRPVPEAAEIAARFFSTQERAIFRALPESKKREAFFNCWTRKEAYIKAVGDGLARPLDQISVTLRPGEPARLLNLEGDPQRASGWSLRELTPGEGYVAAVAAEGQNWSLAFWQWES